jgi:hypothetical protein
MSEFLNEERRRYYGLRKGDRVIAKDLQGNNRGEAIVVEYGSDNNRVMLEFNDKSVQDWVAEWCDIVTKVEDRFPF